MAKIEPGHSVGASVYHDNGACEEGNKIPKVQRVIGTGKNLKLAPRGFEDTDHDGPEIVVHVAVARLAGHDDGPRGGCRHGEADAVCVALTLEALRALDRDPTAGDSSGVPSELGRFAAHDTLDLLEPRHVSERDLSRPVHVAWISFHPGSSP